MKQLAQLGTIESVQFPDYSESYVPAKIDTGADNSAIWASQISEIEGELSFVLFDKSSAYFTGGRITTNDYKVIKVKNSFGQSELRFKVKLKVTIGGRTLRTTFTLANREYNRYPVLIGRHTLSGKFLIDVSQNQTKKSLDILMISIRHSKVNEAFVRNIERYNPKLRFTYVAFDELYFDIGGDTNHISLGENGRDIAEFDLVYFKTINMVIASAVTKYLRKRNVPFLDAAAVYPVDNKLYQYCVLADQNIPIPRSIFLGSDQLEKSFKTLTKRLGLPFILKDIQGRIGENNFLITDQKEFAKVCKLSKKHGDLYIAQCYIENDSDYRVLVFGASVALVIKRVRQDNKTHLNNTSQGGEAVLVPTEDLSSNIQSACVLAAKLMDRQIAGVDIIQDKSTGLWYCLEVNAGPQLATGGFTSEKQAALASYLERRLNK